jgi:hypothetical protein
LSTDNVTVGGASLSTMVIVTCCVPSSVALVTSVISAITVSSGSSDASSMASTVAVPLVLPAGIVIWDEEIA